MEVEFRRTGSRRYAVTVRRAGFPVLEMNPAPGYDDWIPHDLVHFAVEQELRLRGGLFGQLAAGGTVGTFHLAPTDDRTRREEARQRKAVARRGAKLMRAGRDDSAASERAASQCYQAWRSRFLRRSGPPDTERKWQPPDRPSSDRRAAIGESLRQDQIDRVCERLDELSARWARLKIGQSLTVTWSDPSRTLRPNKGLQRTRR